MSLFQRKKAVAAKAEPDEAEQARLAEQQAEDEAERLAESRWQAAERLRSRQGPHDISEVEDSEAMIDLGSLKIRHRDGMELRMEVAEPDQVVRSVTAVVGASQVQLHVFAAPRTLGVWDDVRTELVGEIARQGGTAEEQSGTFGQEILARLPMQSADGRTGHQPTRFIGVDGPRWFLRGVIAGAAVTDPGSADEIEDVIKTCVVERGGEAQPPRELLTLTLPAGATRRSAAEEASDQRPAMAPPERGPEIAEIR